MDPHALGVIAFILLCVLVVTLLPDPYERPK